MECSSNKQLVASVLPVDEVPCAVDPKIFFPVNNTQADDARTICGTCPVRSQCLADALARREPHGVWGGHLLLDGVIIDALPRRGRPPKTFPGGDPVVMQ